MSYGSLVLIDANSRLSFSAVLDFLSEFDVRKESESQASIHFEDYCFFLTYVNAGFILDETEELLGLNPNEEQSGFKPSAERIEVTAMADPDMSHFNDFLFVITKLAKHPSLLVYEQAAEEFI